MNIYIEKIENNTVYIVFRDDQGRDTFRTSLGRCIRNYIKPEYDIDEKRKDGFNTEQAFRKLKISKSLLSELERA